MVPQKGKRHNEIKLVNGVGGGDMGQWKCQSICKVKSKATLQMWDNINSGIGYTEETQDHIDKLGEGAVQ